MIQRLLVQHREPNVDRFLEVCVTMELLDLNIFDYGFQIVGPKSNYSQTINQFAAIYNHLKGIISFPEKDRPCKPYFINVSDELIRSCVFRVSLPQHWMFKLDNNRLESFDTIKERINKALQMFQVSYPKSITNDSAILQLLKAGVNKLDLNSYETQAVLDMALAISAIEQSEYVKLEHIAEALQYVSIRNKEDM